jgi:hypothetical protein
MNKLKWSVLIVYALFLIILRITKLAFLSYLPLKKAIYLSVWSGELANNLIQLAHAEYLSKRFGFVIRVPPHNFLKVQ